MKRALIVVFLCCLIFNVVGCDDGIQVTGNVKYPDGTPMPHGFVVAQSAASQYTGALTQEGTFTLKDPTTGKGIPAGQYKVFLQGASNADKGIRYVAPKYTAASTSEITFNVVKGDKNHFEVQVEKP